MLSRRFGVGLAVFFALLLTVFLLNGVPGLSAQNTGKSTATPAEAQYKEDFNGDGVINIADVIALLLYQRANPGDSKGDYNGDGTPNITDAIALLLAQSAGTLTPIEPESVEEEIPHSTGGTVSLGDEVTLTVEPNTFAEKVKITLTETLPDSVPVPEDMPVVGTPVVLTFEDAAGQPVVGDTLSTDSLQVSINVAEYSGSSEDLAAVFVDQDGLVWFLDAGIDESGQSIEASLPVSLIGTQAESGGSQLQSQDPEGILALLGVTYVAAVSLQEFYCKQDAELVQSHGSDSGIPVIFLHGWQPKEQTCLLFYDAAESFKELRDYLWSLNDIKDNSAFRFFNFSYPTFYDPSVNAQYLKAKVDATLGAVDNIVLICHSMGGLVARYYMEELEGTAKVQRIITNGTPHHGSSLANPPMTALLPTEGTESLQPGSGLISTLRSNEGSIIKEKYITYAGNILNANDALNNALKKVAAKRFGENTPSDGIVPLSSAHFVDGVYDTLTFAGYNHFALHGGSGSPGQDLLFEAIYQDLLELIAEYPTPPGPGDVTDIQGISMVSIPGGTFQMGSESGGSNERPVHSVTVSSFQMSAHEITNSQYAAYLNSALAANQITATTSSVTGASGDYSGQQYINLSGYYSSYPDAQCYINYDGSTFTVESGKENYPVVYVTWYGSAAFASYYGMSLPTEAEWEYAARGGRQYEYGTDDGTIGLEKANYNKSHRHPVDAGSYPANPFGLYDMAGNVWEWCSDWYGSSYYSSSVTENPKGPKTGSTRVNRGGSWSDDAGSCRSARRSIGGHPYDGGLNLGFRVVLVGAIP